LQGGKAYKKKEKKKPRAISKRKKRRLPLDERKKRDLPGKKRGNKRGKRKRGARREHASDPRNSPPTHGRGKRVDLGRRTVAPRKGEAAALRGKKGGKRNVEGGKEGGGPLHRQRASFHCSERCKVKGRPPIVSKRESTPPGEKPSCLGAEKEK